MTQADLDRAVARRTGEPAARIRRMGFVLLEPRDRRACRRGRRTPPRHAPARRPE